MGTRLTVWQALSFRTLFVCLFVASATAVCAMQTPGVDTGRFFGLVRLHLFEGAVVLSDSPAPDIKVSALNIATDSRRETITDAAGAFVLADLPRGLYLIGAELRGFYTVLRVETLETAAFDVNFWLRPAPVVSCIYIRGMGCGTLSGTVRGYDNVSLRGVKVTFTNSAADRTETVLAGDLGSFSFSQLPPGAFEIVAGQAGFQTLRIPNIRLSDASYAAQIHLKLRRTSR